MKATQISKENGVVKFNIEFTPEEWKEAINKAYLANRSKFSIDGFRKGKAPRKIIENFYGHDIFWDEALNNLLENGYYDAVKEMDLEVIAQPSLESPEIKNDEPVVVTGTVEVFPEVEVKDYKGLEIEKDFRGRKLHITIKNPYGKESGCRSMTVNGEPCEVNYVPVSLLTENTEIVLSM